MITGRELTAVRSALAGNDPIVLSAYKVLLQKANEALDQHASPPGDFHVPGYYGSDREIHVERKRLLSKDSTAAFHLALAAALAEQASQRRNYAKAASAILGSWATTNNKVSGYDGNLVMCYNGTAFVFAAGLLDEIDGWNQGDREQWP